MQLLSQPEVQPELSVWKPLDRADHFLSFHRHLNELCSSIAVFDRHLCLTNVNLDSSLAYLADKLITKNPGVRSVDGGEMLRPITGKAVIRNLSGVCFKLLERLNRPFMKGN